MQFSINGYTYLAKINRFPAGEQGVVIPNGLPISASSIVINYDWVEYRDSGIIVLSQLLDALERRYSTGYTKTLNLPYVPYSRQDRVCNAGESFSLKVFASLINNLRFDWVFTWDNHSDVATALIDNCHNIPQKTLLSGTRLAVEVSKGNTILVSPDAGAIKKVRDVAKSLSAKEIVRCDKERDIATGKITSTSVLDKDTVLKYDKFLVIDDICEKGGTFLSLAKEIQKINPKARLELYVTHGFFSGGLDELLKLYDNIYTTISVCRLEHENLHIIKEVVSV